MRLIAIIASMALLITPCISVLDSVITGPYNLSFDLNRTKNIDYLVTIDDIKETESLSGDKHIVYGMKIADMNYTSTFATITLIHDEKERQSITPAETVLGLKNLINDISNTRNIETATRTIDSTIGAVGSFECAIGKVYAAIYFPTIDPHLEAAILSSYPWDEGTLSLLKTIHIDKINVTA